MCHRFINFETLDYDHSEGSIQALVNEYLRVLQQAEGATAVLYHKSNSELDKDAGHSGRPGVEKERAWTICIVFNPKRNSKIESAIRA